MESFWATLKSELIQDWVFAARSEAKGEIFRYIEVFYNSTHLYGAPGCYSPMNSEDSLNLSEGWGRD